MDWSLTGMMAEGSAQPASLVRVSWQSIAAVITRHAAPCHASHGHAGLCMAGDLQAVLMVHGYAIRSEPAGTSADLTAGSTCNNYALHGTPSGVSSRMS